MPLADRRVEEVPQLLERHLVHGQDARFAGEIPSARRRAVSAADAFLDAGLIAELAAEADARVILRGVKAVADLSGGQKGPWPPQLNHNLHNTT
jgi:hypothetical protein